MKAEYDLSKLKARKNPYASKLKKPVTMRLSEDVVIYFKSMAQEAGVPYQSLINLYLRDCLANNRKVQVTGRSWLDLTGGGQGPNHPPHTMRGCSDGGPWPVSERLPTWRKPC